jgi:mercuric ion transport protein
VDDRRLWRTGITGSIVTAVCCLTPALAIALAVLGLSAWTGWLDVVLIPLLGVFLALTAFAVYRLRRGRRG